MADSMLGALARRAWWIYLVAGVALAIVGLAIVVWPGTTLEIAVVAIGIGWIVEGVTTLVAVAQRTIVGARGWAIAAGIVSVLAGIVAVLFPSTGAVLGVLTFVFILGFGMVFSGVRWAILGWRQTPRDWWGVVLGALYVVGAVILMLNPMAGGIALVIVLGAWAIVAGITAIIAAFVVRGTARELQDEAEAARREA